MLGIYIKRTCTADDQQTCIAAAEKIAKMLRSLDVHRLLFVCPRAEAVNYSVKARDIIFGEIHNILFYIILRNGFVFVVTSECLHLKASVKRFFNDLLCYSAVCCYNCDFHNIYLRKLILLYCNLACYNYNITRIYCNVNSYNESFKKFFRTLSRVRSF